MAIAKKERSGPQRDGIDSKAYTYTVNTTLTIRNLDQAVKHKLRQQAALHDRSMEAEAREILARGVEKFSVPESCKIETPQERMRKALDSVTGIWAGRGTTDELMRELRGED